MRGKIVLVASEVPLYAESIQWMLNRIEGMEAAAVECRDGNGLAELAREAAHAYVVECGGLLNWSALQALCTAVAPSPVIVLTRQASMETVYQAREAGVRALIDLRAPSEGVMEGIRRAMEGEMVFPESDEEAQQRTRRIKLTPREGQLVAMLVQGLKNKEIATQLDLSEGTVKVYLSKLFQKVGAKDRFELALFGLRNLVNGEYACVAASPRRKPARILGEPERRGLRTLMVGGGGIGARAMKAGSAG